MITKLLAWCLLNYGLMNIMVYGSIFKNFRDFFHKWGQSPYAPFRPLGNFISGTLTCPMCFSFHGGWFMSLFIFSPTFELFSTPIYISWFFDAIISSGAVWAINAIIEWFERNRPSQNNN